MSRESLALICDHLQRSANAKAVVILDGVGNIVARAGDVQLLTGADVWTRKAMLASASDLISSFHEAHNGTLLISSGHPLTIGVLFDQDSSPASCVCECGRRVWRLRLNSDLAAGSYSSASVCNVRHHIVVPLHELEVASANVGVVVESAIDAGDPK